MTAPVLQIPVRFLRSAVAGRRPGDGNFRALNDGDLFVNTQDKVLCFLNAAGAVVAFPIDPAAVALLASPALTGSPTAPTATVGDNTTKLATTAYADRAASNAQTAAVNNAPVKSVAGRTGAIVLAVTDVSGAAPLASPGFTGAPTGPTAAAADASTKLATTGYADRAALSNAPADGCCRLSAASSTSLKLSALDGNTLFIGGVACTIPSAGVLISNSTLPASTFCYVYAAATSGVVSSLSISSTGYLLDAMGRAYKSNGQSSPAADGVNRLVGWIITNGSSQFQDTPTFRGVGNFFKRRNIFLYEPSGTGPATTSTTPVALLGYCYFAVWADEAVLHGQVEGSGHVSVAGSGSSTQLMVNGAVFGTAQAQNAGNTGGFAVAISVDNIVPAEQYASLNVFGNNAYAAATSTWDTIVLSGFFRG